MKKKLLLFSKISLLFICNLLIKQSIAQSITHPVPAQAISRSLDSTLLTVKIDLPTCTNIKVTVNLGFTNNPGNVEYVPNTITKIAGSAGITITESNISNLRNPVFSVSNTNIGNTITFTLKRKVNCGFAVSSKDRIVVTGTGAGCNFNESDVNINTYNILAPALSLSPVADLTNANIGNTYTRTITLINGGNGCLDTLGFWIKYPVGSIQLNSLKINGITITPIAAYSNADSTYFDIAGTDLGPTKKICSGQTVTFTENITILKCNAVTTYGTAWYNKESDEECQKTFTTANIIMSNSVPILVTTLPTPNYNYCWVGENQKQTLRIVNRGTGPATNIKINFGNAFSGFFQARYTFDTLTPWIIKNKLGATIGVVNNFNNLIVRSVRNATCAVVTRVDNALGTLGNLILLPGDTIYIDVYANTENISCVECLVATGWTGISTDTRYENQCGTANYSSKSSHMTRAYAYFDYKMDMPTDILPNVPFNLEMFFVYGQTMNNPNGSGNSILIIPLAGTNILPTVTSVNLLSNLGAIKYTYPINVINDTMFVGPFPKNVTNASGNLTIPMVATCGTGGAKTLRPYISNTYGTCSPAIRFYCSNINTNLHCPGVCPKGGATPINFSLRRITYGSADNNNNSIPDGGASVLDLNKIADHRSVNGDTLQGTWHIKVYPNVESTTNGYASTDANFGKRIFGVYLDFDLRYAQSPVIPLSLTALPNAVMKIYPNSDPLATPIICTVSPTFSGTKAHYEFDSMCRGMAWQPNDSIVLQAKYRTNTNSQGSGEFVFVTKNEVYSSYIRKTVPSLAPIDGQTYTCDHFGDYNKLIQIYQSPWIASGFQLNGCSNLIIAEHRQYLRVQEGPNIFPYEYRNLFAVDSMTVLIPPGFSYRLNSATIYFLNAGGDTLPIPNNKITQIGTKLYFTNLKTFYTTYGGSVVPADETQSVKITFSIDPQCEAVNGNYPSSVHTSGIGNGIIQPLLAGTLPTIIQHQAIGYIYTAPQPVLIGGGTIYSTDGTATWNLALQNQSNLVPAPFQWLAISNASSFTNIIIKKNNVVVLPDVDNIYQLGDLAASSQFNITITASSLNCNEDSLQVVTQWDCQKTTAAYNPIFLTQGCNQVANLKFEAYPSQIQLETRRQPKLPYLELCKNDSVEFVLNSAQASFVDNPLLVVTPPIGVNIIKCEVEYPEGSGNWQTFNDSIILSKYYFNLENHLQLKALYGNKGLPGTINFPGSFQREIKLRIVFATTCNFIANNKFTVQQRGSKPCGKIIPNALGYNAIVRTDPIKILGVGNTGTAAFNLSLTPDTIACGSTTLSGSVTPIGENTGFYDTVVVTIPDGIKYIASSFLSSGINAMLVPGSPFVGPGNSQILKIKLNAGVLVGTPINYSFRVTPNWETPCGNYQILSDVQRSSEPLSCNGTLCPNQSTSIIANSIKDLFVDKPQIVISNVVKLSGDVYPGGAPISLQVTVQNNSLTTTAPLNSLQCIFYCSSGGNIPFMTLPFPAAVPPSSSVSQVMNFFIPNSTLCLLGDQIRMEIISNPSNCICEDANFTIPFVFLANNTIKLTATKKLNTGLLTFVVGSPILNGSYVIERSNDNNNFVSIGTLSANGSTFYNFIDNNPIMNQKNYYRIRQIDVDLKESISEFKIINFANNKGYDVFPNPAKDRVNIQVITSNIGKQLRFTLFSANGQRVLSVVKKQANAIEIIDIKKLAKGTYSLKIENNLDNPEYIKIVITN